MSSLVVFCRAQCLVPLEHPPGSPFLKASHCMKGLAARWNSISKDKQEKETADAMKDLEDHHESKQLALHNVPLNTFQDVQKSLKLLDREVSMTFVLKNVTTSG